MILSNVEIIKALESGLFNIEPLAGKDPRRSPFNTSAVDLRLATQILRPKCDSPVQLDLRKAGIAKFWAENSEKIQLSRTQPYVLERGCFILAQTFEKVSFPLHATGTCYSARVEGRSSLPGVALWSTSPPRPFMQDLRAQLHWK
jgi:dCTP deaminase